MNRYKARPYKTKYWRPSDDYLKSIVNIISRDLRNGDIVVISEKAVSSAKGLIVDEAKVTPTLLSKCLARFWMKWIWGYVLAQVCHLKPLTIRRLKNYPLVEGARHKQLAFAYVGFLQALRHGSEGGIDVSNLPYAYASLPLAEAYREAELISTHIYKITKKSVGVMIVDTDMTYSFKALNLTPRPKPLKGIVSFGGFITYVICRALKLKPRATPLAVSGVALEVNEALDLAEMAHHLRGSGAGRSAWDSSERFGVGLTDVSWDMLEKIPHYPIVLFRLVQPC